MTTAVKIYISTIFLLFSISLKGQNRDTTHYGLDWSPFKFGLRSVLGFQKTIYSEIGVSYHRAYFDPVQPASNCFYSTFSWIPTILPIKSDNIYGFNIGFENNSHLAATAIELKYLTNLNGREDFLIIPKVGIGVLGFVNFLYGYSFPIRKEFIEIGNHQFSLTVNINKHLTKK